MRVRTVVSAPFFVDSACLENAGEVLVGDTDAGVGLAVLQQHIVSRVIFLDERVLQEKGVLLCIYDCIADVMDLRDEHLGLETIHLCVEVRRDPCFEVLRLPHIDDGLCIVIELVAARLVRQSADNTLQVG